MENQTEITIAYVALERAEKVQTGETRTAMQSRARLVPVKVRSLETKNVYVIPIEEIALGRFEICGVTPALMSKVDTSMPSLKEPDGLEFSFNPVTST